MKMKGGEGEHEEKGRDGGGIQLSRLEIEVHVLTSSL